MVIGNKCDQNGSRVVSKLEGKTYCYKNRCFFAEVSAQNDINITEIFYKTITSSIRKNNKMVVQEDSGIFKTANPTAIENFNKN